jgi:hypothetical protein
LELFILLSILFSKYSRDMDYLALADIVMVGVEGNPLVEGFSLLLLLGLG